AAASNPPISSVAKIRKIKPAVMPRSVRVPLPHAGVSSVSPQGSQRLSQMFWQQFHFDWIFNGMLDKRCGKASFLDGGLVV
ncbi:MAG TPA: hypothetical protein VFO36_09910, partial [Nitrospiraceae bacterium]|nr:hypothetical protein [Nitrospiraceae bacterium]